MVAEGPGVIRRHGGVEYEGLMSRVEALVGPLSPAAASSLWASRSATRAQVDALVRSRHLPARHLPGGCGLPPSASNALDHLFQGLAPLESKSPNETNGVLSHGSVPSPRR